MRVCVCVCVLSVVGEWVIMFCFPQQLAFLVRLRVDCLLGQGLGRLDGINTAWALQLLHIINKITWQSRVIITWAYPGIFLGGFWSNFFYFISIHFISITNASEKPPRLFWWPYVNDDDTILCTSVDMRWIILGHKRRRCCVLI